MDIDQVKSTEQKLTDHSNSIEHEQYQQTSIKREELATLRSKVGQLCEKVNNFYYQWYTLWLSIKYTKQIFPV